jgi:NADH:ubiquinone oxidoreductase subunit 4 (subunit M)
MGALIRARISLLTSQKTLRTLMQTTTLLCSLFFSSNRTLLSFTMFELASLPIVYAILVFGHQIEILNATQIITTYSLLRRLPLLLFLSHRHNTNNFWLDQSIRPERTLLFILPFLVKTPTYLLHL